MNLIEWLLLVAVLLAVVIVLSETRRRAIRRPRSKVAYREEPIVGRPGLPPSVRYHGAISGRVSHSKPHHESRRRSDDDDLGPVILVPMPEDRPIRGSSPHLGDPAYRTGGTDEPTTTFRTGGSVVNAGFTTGGSDLSSDYKSSTPSDGGSKSSDSGGSSDSGSSGGSSE